MSRVAITSCRMHGSNSLLNPLWKFFFHSWIFSPKAHTYQQWLFPPQFTHGVYKFAQPLWHGWDIEFPCLGLAANQSQLSMWNQVTPTEYDKVGPRAGLDILQMRKSLPLLEIKAQLLGCLACSLVTISIELPWLYYLYRILPLAADNLWLIKKFLILKKPEYTSL